MLDLSAAGAAIGEDYPYLAMQFADIGSIQDPNFGSRRWWDAAEGCISVQYKWTRAAWQKLFYDPLITVANSIYNNNVTFLLAANPTNWNANGDPTEAVFELNYQEAGNGSRIPLGLVDSAPFTKRQTADRWQTIELRWRAATIEQTQYAPDGFVQVFWNGVLVIDRQNIRLLIAPSFMDPSPTPNLVRSLWLGAHGLFGPTTNLTVTTSTLRNADIVQPPTVTLTSPSNGAHIASGTSVSVTADASDPQGISRVDFFANRSLIGSSTTAPYAVIWAPADGAYILRATATNSVGGAATSTGVSVTVGNLSHPAVPTGPDHTSYYDVDAIGSVRQIINDAGTITARYDYLPFGERWNAPSATQPREFAGKEQDPETGFDYIGGRFLFPVTGNPCYHPTGLKLGFERNRTPAE